MSRLFAALVLAFSLPLYAGDLYVACQCYVGDEPDTLETEAYNEKKEVSVFPSCSVSTGLQMELKYLPMKTTKGRSVGYVEFLTRRHYREPFGLRERFITENEDRNPFEVWKSGSGKKKVRIECFLTD